MKLLKCQADWREIETYENETYEIETYEIETYEKLIVY
jgi:hypothetical protein